jgi:hypothetical protein
VALGKEGLCSRRSRAAPFHSHSLFSHIAAAALSPSPRPLRRDSPSMLRPLLCRANTTAALPRGGSPHRRRPFHATVPHTAAAPSLATGHHSLLRSPATFPIRRRLTPFLRFVFVSLLLGYELFTITIVTIVKCSDKIV